MNNERFTIAVSGGATGGHVIPAINICREIRKRNPDINIIYIGTGGSLEERLAIQEGYQFKKVKMAYLRRSLSLKNFILPFIALTAVLQAIVYLEVYKARFVIGTGGYSALPALAAAWALGIPYVLQEQNAFPGLVTRIMSREARRIYVGYGEVADHIRTNPDKIIETGNPVWCESLKMSKETVREQFGLIQNRKTIFITGGSGGAKSINNVIDQIKGNLIDRGYNLIWQTGKHFNGSTSIKTEWQNYLKIERFLDRERMQMAYRAADLVIARCGAMTLAELAIHGLPAILIPFPFSAEGHQEANGRAIEAAGGAKMILDRDLTSDVLLSMVENVMQSNRLIDMSVSMETLARPEATGRIVDDIMKLIQ